MNKLAIISAFFILSLVSYTTGQINGQGGSGSSCPIQKPYRCPDSSCAAKSSSCPINPCTGTTPYQCSDSTCQISSIYCNCQGVVCSDGSCKTSITQCPILASCSELYPRRCPDGTCTKWNATCTNHTGTVCPSGLQLCVDGICRTSDLCTQLPFHGCSAYECPTGQCATNYSSCLCPNQPTMAKCYDGSCTPLGVACATTSPAFLYPMNLTVTIDTQYNSSINCPPTNNNNGSVVVIQTPPGGGANGRRSFKRQDTLDTLQIRSVPSSYTDGSTIYDSSSNSLIPAYIATPPVSLSLGSGNQFSGSTELSFPNAQKPSPTSDLCVASLNATNKEWKCSSSGSTTVGNTVSSYVSLLTIWAVVVQPTCIVSGSESGASFCARQTWDAGTIGYFCANGGHSFYMCWEAPTTWASSIQSCPTGTSCSCCSTNECSNHNLESPCR